MSIIVVATRNSIRNNSHVPPSLCLSVPAPFAVLFHYFVSPVFCRKASEVFVRRQF